MHSDVVWSTSSKSLFKVNYYNSSVGVVENGRSYARDDVQTAPLLSVSNPANSTTEFTSLHTINWADPGSSRDPNLNGSFRRAMTNAAVASNVATLNIATSSAAMLAPMNLSQPYTVPSRFNVTLYVEEAGGLELIAATFFLVKYPNGTATGSVITTTPWQVSILRRPRIYERAGDVFFFGMKLIANLQDEKNPYGTKGDATQYAR
ncbi:BQ2448_1887 [Microbotryum intermedium]|uniref:BQ2448_1887 protein n=1 Tax=Microbotryum intermedium TaxID=269621 RepID=A0A238FES5_9BASI|nr:BQ2448_1887 [Microbotryum intermedium]